MCQDWPCGHRFTKDGVFLLFFSLLHLLPGPPIQMLQDRGAIADLLQFILTLKAYGCRISAQFGRWSLSRFPPSWSLAFDFFLLVLQVLQKQSPRTARLTSGLRIQLALMLLVQRMVNFFAEGQIVNTSGFAACMASVQTPLLCHHSTYVNKWLSVSMRLYLQKQVSGWARPSTDSTLILCLPPSLHFLRFELVNPIPPYEYFDVLKKVIFIF